MTFTGNHGYPQAQIDHGKVGDDHLNRYYKKRGTFSGATVYIKSDVDNNPVASAQSSASAQYQAEPQSVVDNDRQGEEDRLGGRGVKRSRPC